ncbi:MAG: fatty acid desaturase [Casimicrobiaceae bacterium]
MNYDFFSLAAHGIVDLPWWGYLVVALVLTHVTIASVTIYLHRAQAHRALDLHPVAAHFFRFWLWLTTGMVTKEWVAIHRKHHAKVETADDPHSPQTRGIDKVFWEGAELYRAESKNLETLDKYGHGTPDDWLENNCYSRFSWQGVGLMLVVNVFLFGALGLSIWAVQMVWIPITAAGIINGIGHYFGYRNFACADASKNIVPWGILIGGEELHNNHHAYGTSAKLSSRWYEFDIGWLYIRMLAAMKMATVRKLAPPLKVDPTKAVADIATLQAVITHRYAVAAQYARSVKQACAVELAHLRERARHHGNAGTHIDAHHAELLSPRRIKRWLLVDPAALPDVERTKLAAAMATSKALATIYAMRQELGSLWERSTESSEQLLARLQDWCHRAEASGIAPLAQFSINLRRYA